MDHFGPIDHYTANNDPDEPSHQTTLYFPFSYSIGGFRDSQSDIIFAHAHIRGHQRYGQLYGICVKCGFIF